MDTGKRSENLILPFPQQRSFPLTQPGLSFVVFSLVSDVIGQGGQWILRHGREEASAEMHSVNETTDWAKMKR